jgi:hypothetical protein
MPWFTLIELVSLNDWERRAQSEEKRRSRSEEHPYNHWRRLRDFRRLLGLIPLMVTSTTAALLLRHQLHRPLINTRP